MLTVIQHLMFSDFSDLIKEPESKYAEKGFWDWLDALLAERHAKYSDIFDDRERAAKFNRCIHFHSITCLVLSICVILAVSSSEP